MVFAAAGAWSGYLMIQWTAGLFAPGMVGADAPFAVAALVGLAGPVGLAVFWPLLHWRKPPSGVTMVVAAVIGAAGLIASVGTTVAGAVTVCPDLCGPDKTWPMLPTIGVAALLAALGPMIYAVGRRRRDLGGFPDTRGQVFWGLAVILGVVGFGFAMIWWVEIWLYPGS